jgi:Sap-like sulfolipid-1-addressing protein
MNLNVVVLALASAPRPAGIAALYALLSASPPRRVLVAYLLAGLTFSVAVGVLVVAIFYGAGIDYRGTDVYSAIELLGGLAALGFAVGVWTGRRQPPARDEGAGEESAIIRRLRNPSVPTALIAGVATHLPGLFYLVALNAIVREAQPRRRDPGGPAVQRHLVRCSHCLGRDLSAPSGGCAQGAGPRQRLGTTSRPQHHGSRIHRGRLLPGDQRCGGPGRLRPRRLARGASADAREI